MTTKTKSGYRPGRLVTRGWFDAECQTCAWRCSKVNALGAGAIHAKRFGHCVRVTIERTVVYNHEAS